MAVAGHMSGRMFEHYHHVRTTAKRAALERLERGSSLSDSDGGRSRARTADLLLVRAAGALSTCVFSLFSPLSLPEMGGPTAYDTRMTLWRQPVPTSFLFPCPSF